MFNKAISLANEARYAVTDSVGLTLNRQANRYDYSNPNPLISIYIPTFNRSQILMERGVNSVLNQSYTNWELIVVGDCCTDKTEAVMTELAGRDKRVRFFNLESRERRYPPTAENHWLAGPVVAANFALTQVQGQWIARNDDDDIWFSTHLERLLEFARNGDFEFVSSSYLARKNGRDQVVYAPPIGGTQTWLYRSYLKFMRYNINCWRKSWNRVNDTDMAERMVKAGVKTGYYDGVTCLVSPRPGEDQIGSKAYLENAARYEKFFAFEGSR